MRKILSIILLIASCLIVLAGCSKKAVTAKPSVAISEDRPRPVDPTESSDNSQEAQDTAKNKLESRVHPLLWDVSAKNGDGHIYLFGSIHIADDTLYPLPSVIENAFAECESLAVEFDSSLVENDTSIQVSMLTSMLIKDGDIHDVMDDELYDKVKNFLTENGMPYSTLYDIYNAYFWSSLVEEILLEKSPYSGDLGVDSHFISEAHECGKEIIDIESFEFQLDLLNSVPAELQTAIIENDIDNADAYTDGLMELYDAYCEGNEELLAELSLISADDLETVGYSKEEATILRGQIDDYNRVLLTERNVNMEKAAEDFLECGKNVFYVVGIAHMVGDDGIVSLLREAGYTVNFIEY